MSDIAIRVEGLSKQYRIGAPERYRTLRDTLTAVLAAPFRRLRNGHADKAESERIWALKDVSFEVKHGDVIGIIGRNGAGKSTLLKILSRITEPTKGHAEIRGRVASLLEVGTGFHPELTGRENIFLNGAIMGMKKVEILRKFDEIVAFAEVAKFIDTPVKRYSSGMYVRLAFAVAAHLEPDILVVDEVLSVGDADFQKKCLGKMSQVATIGRTVLFVSHNLPTVASLCTRAVLLHDGQVLHQGEVASALARYRGGAEICPEFSSTKLKVNASIMRDTLGSSDATVLQLDITLRGPLISPSIGIGINDIEGKRIATIFSDADCELPAIDNGGELSLRIRTEAVRFAPGTLVMKLSLVDQGREIEAHEDVLRLLVPDYWPFLKPTLFRPRGGIFLKHKTSIWASEEQPIDVGAAVGS